MIIHHRRTWFRCSTVWIKEAKLFPTKQIQVDEELKDKVFIQIMKSKINTYKDQLSSASIYSFVRPAPVDVNFPNTMSPQQQEFATHILEMLQVTKYPWEEKKHIGKIQTVIGSLG